MTLRRRIALVAAAVAPAWVLLGCGPGSAPRPPLPVDTTYRAPLLVSEEGTDADLPSLAVDGDGYPWVAFVAFRDGRTSIRAVSITATGAGEQIEVSEATEEDVTAPTVVSLGDRGMLAAWTSFEDEEPWLRYAMLDPVSGTRGEVRRVGGDPALLPTMESDGEGGAWLAAVHKHAGRLVLRVHRYRDGRFEEPLTLSEPTWNAWDPELVAVPGGVAVAYDRSAPGRSTDVVLRRVVDGEVGRAVPIATSPLFEAHPSIARHPDGRLVVAYDVGDARWSGGGSRFTMRSSLHLRRSVAIRVLDGDRLLEPREPIASLLPDENRAVHEYPRVALDESGRAFVVLRSVATDNPLPKNERSVWRGLAVGPGGAGRLRFSAGRNDVRPALARDAGGRILAAWSADLRTLDRARESTWFRPAVADGQHRVYVDDLRRVVGGAGDLLRDLVDADANQPGASLADIETFEARAPWMPDDWELPSGPQDPPPPSSYEPFVVETADGRRLRAWFGDLHRHSDISRCWMNKDGSLEDAYRYALDVARLDFVSVTNHPAHMTSWDRRRQELSVDQFSLSGELVTFFGYEHVEPLGHKNVIFPSRRGKLVSFDRSARAGRDDALSADPGQFLAKLKGSGALAIPHTPAGQGPGDPSGTDWSFHDPEVQRLVEIFQGYRGSYESADAPRVFPIPTNPDGFVDRALARGLELGFIASSDHHSMMGGYAGVFAEEKTREAIFGALHARHTFGATDRIALFVDTDAGGMMGDGVSARERIGLRVVARGTGPIARLVVIRDGEVAATRDVGAITVDTRFDIALADRDHSYVYVRLEQMDGELAWASPVFVRR